MKVSKIAKNLRGLILKKETEIGVFQNRSQQIKVLVTKVNNLSSVSKNNIMDGEKQFLQVDL